MGSLKQEQQRFALPMKCRRCGASFDLKHDLLDKGFEGKDEMNEVLSGFGEHFCWECRNVLSGESEATGDEGEIEGRKLEELELNVTLSF
jgi:hypothetical protein